MSTVRFRRFKRKISYAFLLLVVCAIFGMSLVLLFFDDKRGFFNQQILLENKKDINPLSDPPEPEAFFYEHFVPPNGSFGIGETTFKTVNTSLLKQKIKNNCDWALQVRNPQTDEWVNITQRLNIHLNWSNLTNSYKITMNFTTLDQGVNLDYRIALLFKQRVKNFVNRSDTEVTFSIPANSTEWYNLSFNWSDMLQYSGLIFNRGKTVIDGEDYFYFIVRRNDVPPNYFVELDPSFGYESSHASVWNIGLRLGGSYYTCTEDGTADSICVYLMSSVVSGEKVKCGIYYYNSRNKIAETEERSDMTGPGWFTFDFVSPPSLTSGDKYILGAVCNNDGEVSRSGSGCGSNLMDTNVGNYEIPSTWVDGHNYSGYCVSIYCNYSTEIPREQTEVFDFWFSGGNITDREQTSVFDFWFSFANVTERTKTEVFDSWMSFGNITSRVETEVFDFWFSFGNFTLLDPTITGEVPNNNSINIFRQPIVNVTVSDFNIEDVMNVTFATNSSIVIGEVGFVTVENGEWHNLSFQNSYENTPVVIAVPSSNRRGGGNTSTACTSCTSGCGDDACDGILPTINYVGTDCFNVTIYYDSGNATADYYPGESDDLCYWVIDTDAIADLDWIDAGVEEDCADAGVDVTVTFNKELSGTPYVFLCPQTYRQEGNVSAVYWEDGGATSTQCNILGGTHQGTGDSMDSSTPHEDVGWLVIDVSENDIVGFESGSADISNSLWTDFSHTATNPRVIVCQNDDDGAQDPEYYGSRKIFSGDPEFHYCEQDGDGICNTHTGEVTVWACIDADDENNNIVINGGESWINYQTNSSVENNTNVSWNMSMATEYNTKYWWRVYCDDGNVNISETYSYTTVEESIPAETPREQTEVFDSWMSFGNITSRGQTEVFDRWFSFGNITSRIKIEVFDKWLTFGNVTNRNQAEIFDKWMSFGNITERLETNIFDKWFTFGNITNRIGNQLFDYWFSINNITNRDQAEVFDYYFTFGNITGRTQTEVFDNYFTFGNITERLETNIFDKWFTFGNTTSRISTEVFDYYFTMGNITLRSQQNIFDYYFTFGNITPRTQTNVFDHWFTFNNITTRQVTNIFDNWFTFGNTTSRIETEVFDLWFSFGNITSRIQTEVFDSWISFGNVTGRTQIEVFDKWFTFGNETGRKQINIFDSWISFGNITIVYLNISNVHPVDGSSVTSLFPTLYFTINQTFGDMMDYYVYHSDDWYLLGNGSGMVNGTYYVPMVNASTIGTRYNWSVNITDGNHWLNNTYNFRVRYENMGGMMGGGYGMGMVMAIGGGFLLFGMVIGIMVFDKRRKK